MPRTSSERRFAMPLLLALAAAAGAALALVVGAIAIQVGPWADRKATSAGCQCDGADGSAGDESRRQSQLENDELRRAFLAALARDPGCDDTPANQPDQPAPLEYPVEDQADLEVPSTEEIVAQEQAELASLLGELNQEPVDPVWAPVTEQATARAVAAAESMHLEEVTCRESLCRVRVTHRDLAKREDDVEKLLGVMPWGGQARVYAPTGDPTTVMYFSRKGMLLSALAPRVPSVLPPPIDPGGGQSQPPAPLAN